MHCDKSFIDKDWLIRKIEYDREKEKDRERGKINRDSTLKGLKKYQNLPCLILKR